MNLGTRLGSALVIGALFAVTFGCQKKEGPVEQAGKQVDQAVDQLQDAAKSDKK